MHRPIPSLAVAAALLTAALSATLAPPLAADEGMWTLDNLPLAQLKERYGFTPTPDWIDHLQKASVSFGGGSGAFVSPNGLVLTNHHVALGQLHKVSTAERDFVHDGFFARTAAEEMKCPDLELRVLMSTEDVTDRVRRAIDAKAPGSVQSAQRKAVTATIEKESSQSTGLQSRMVELYHGGEYWLYRYKKYTDVRLVMAPEQGIAFFGGDPDNFCYPRHDLDFAFFRIYEDGKPVHPARWFRWSEGGPSDSELVFVSGNPGSTSRRLTVAQLQYLRDASHPIRIRQQERRLAALRAYAARGPEQARRSLDRIFGLENNLKRQRAYLEVLRDPAVMDLKRKEEAALRARVAKDPRLAAECGGAWDRIAAAEREQMRRHREYLSRDLSRGARLVALAADIVRYATETEKPNDKRFEEYRDSNLESLRFQMFSPAPIYPDLDAVTLAAQLADALDALGPKDAFVRLALGGRSPTAMAEELMQKTKVGDVAFRKQLVAGGRAAVEASDDPLIVWTRQLEPSYRELRAWYEDNIKSVESLEGARIARARFALDGKSVDPDATGTLRLSYGRVAGYDQLTTRVPWKTTFLGLYDRARSFDDRAPFTLPKRVAAARPRLDLDTPLDFVATADIIGGNSGSPVLSRNLEYVGLIFDGNTQSFAWDYVYDDRQARAVAVHSSAILEALRKIYGMDALAAELTTRTQMSGR
jgi:V8-like Glu-specific endopeptidase